MADLTFSKKTLTLSGLGGMWKARSGSSNFAALENGPYTAPPFALMTGTEKVAGVPFDKKYAKKSFVDTNGFGWFMWLGKTEQGKSGLGIHPDGNDPGTEGCIGITERDTRPLFEKLRSKAKTGLTVEVKD